MSDPIENAHATESPLENGIGEPACAALSDGPQSLPSSRTPGQGQTLLNAAIVAGLIAGTGFVFAAVRHHGFVNFDDDVYVYDNPVVKRGLTLDGVRWAFTSVHGSNWHPLTWLSHMLDVQWYGLNAGGHHFTGVMLHALTAVVLFLLLRKLTAARWPSAILAGVFAVHPLRVESVAWIAERKDVLCAFFFLLSLLAYARWCRGRDLLPRGNDTARLQGKAPLPTSEPCRAGSPDPAVANQTYSDSHTVSSPIGSATAGSRDPASHRIRSFSPSCSFPGWSLALFALALLAKPMAVTLPVILLLLDYWPLNRLTRASLPRLLLEKAPFVFLSLAACGTTLFAQRDALTSIPLGTRLANAALSATTYLSQMFYPAGLAVYYPYHTDAVSTGRAFAALAVLIGISIAAVVCRKTQPWLLFGWLWFLVMLLPVIGIVQVGSQAHADRYTYLPQIGVAVALVWALADLGARWRMPRGVFAAATAVVLVTLGGLTRAQVGYWRDSESLWRRALACTSRNVIAHDNLGSVLLSKGAVDEARVQLEAALAISPDHVKAHNNLGNALLQRGDLDGAVQHFERALTLKPDYVEAYNNLGVALIRLGRGDDAIRCFRKAVEIDPAYAAARNSLGLAQLEAGQIDEAIACFERALAIEPTYDEAHYNLGNALLKRGGFDAAVAHYRRALELNPGYLDAENNLGYALLQTGRVDEAIACFDATLRADRNNVSAHFNLGSALLGRERLDEAAEHFRTILVLQPDAVPAAKNLAFILVREGRVGDAIAQYEAIVGRHPDNVGTLNNLAWVLATCPSAALRNGPRAVELAERANRLANGADPLVLRTFAAAFAETGRFAEAADLATKALPLAQSRGDGGLADLLRRQIDLYRSGAPWRDDSLIATSPAVASGGHSP